MSNLKAVETNIKLSREFVLKRGMVWLLKSGDKRLIYAGCYRAGKAMGKSATIPFRVMADGLFYFFKSRCTVMLERCSSSTVWWLLSSSRRPSW